VGGVGGLWWPEEVRLTSAFNFVSGANPSMESTVDPDPSHPITFTSSLSSPIHPSSPTTSTPTIVAYFVHDLPLDLISYSLIPWTQPSTLL
jgi:hypothetical protein